MAETLSTHCLTRLDHSPLNSPVQAITFAIMNSEAVSALIAKNPSLKAAKAKLEAMEPGAYVSIGAGVLARSRATTRLPSVSSSISKARKPIRWIPAFCLTTMDVLPAKHLLVRKETEPKKSRS